MCPVPAANDHAQPLADSSYPCSFWPRPVAPLAFESSRALYYAGRVVNGRLYVELVLLSVNHVFMYVRTYFWFVVVDGDEATVARSHLV